MNTKTGSRKTALLVIGVTIVAWTFLLSALLLKWSLAGSALGTTLRASPSFYPLLIGLVPFFAGFIIVDLEKIVLGGFLSISLASLVTFFLLSLAIPMGILPNPAFSDIVYIQSTRLLFSVVFPIPIVLNMALSLVGGCVGEIFARKINGVNPKNPYPMGY